MINREHSLSVTQQCRILNLSRSGVYYIPVLVNDRDRELMNLIDRIHLEE
jgi:putative transposase